MNAPLILAVPSKGRLQENAESFFARAGLELVKPRGARDYRGTVAGLDGIEIAYLSAAEITAQLAQGAAHLGITGEDLVREMIPQSDRTRRADRGTGLRLCQCRRRGAAGLDRRAQHGRSRRRRHGVPPQARAQDAARHQIRQSDARLFRRARRGRLSHRRKLRRHRRRAGGRHRRNDRRYHHDRRHACRQRAESDRGRRHPALAGQSRRRARRGLDQRTARDGALAARPHRRAKTRRGLCAKCAPALPA